MYWEGIRTPFKLWRGEIKLDAVLIINIALGFILICTILLTIAFVMQFLDIIVTLYIKAGIWQFFDDRYERPWSILFTIIATTVITLSVTGVAYLLGNLVRGNMGELFKGIPF